MIAIEPLNPSHLARFEPQAAQRSEVTGRMAAASEHGPSFAAVDDSGRVLCVAGLARNHARYVTAWALFADRKGAGMLAVTRAIRRVLDQAARQYDRIDMLVRDGFDRAADFAALIGFEREAVLKRGGPDGEDLVLFARVTDTEGGR